jgi:hypothetical protein
VVFLLNCAGRLTIKGPVGGACSGKGECGGPGEPMSGGDDARLLSLDEIMGL